LARQLAHIGYRSPKALTEKFDRKVSGSGRFDVLSYLDHQGEKFCGRFDANSYIRLTECMNSHDIGRGRDGAASALKTLQLPILVLSISSDQLYPVEEQVFIAQHTRKAKHVVINTSEGHDGFLIEADVVNQHIEKFLKKIPQAIK
jgi:homoserine O-acetyltransferase